MKMPGLAIYKKCPWCEELTWLIIRDNPAYNSCDKCGEEIKVKIKIEAEKKHHI